MLEDNHNLRITIAGARGTMPVCGADKLIYGGDTMCVLLHMGTESIILDAGTGLREYSKYLAQYTGMHHLLLSHSHFDHLLGLPMCSAFYQAGLSFSLYAEPRSGLSAKEQLLSLMAPPLWPITPNAFLAKVRFCDIVTPMFQIGDVCVEVMAGNHPGGCSIFKLSYQGKSVVYVTDYEQGTKTDNQLVEFAAGCDLFLCDGQYSDQEFPHRVGFGHSSWHEAAKLGQRCQAGHTMIIHHAPDRTDQELDAAAALIQREYGNCTFAHAKEEIIL
ncbi:MAG: MBL fold metallo-hydrolase [Lachnospiraceae bacterium]